jgi:protein-S-isoprenylcysteine O-methyltransferase Ste14
MGSALDDPSWWIAGLAWAGWLLFGNGRVRLSAADRVADRGTFGVAWAVLLASLGMALLLAVLWPAGTISGPSWIPRVSGALVAGAGLAIRGWAIRALGSSFTQVVTTRSDQLLVTSGPYRYVRHPGYAGSLATLTGLGLTLGNCGSLFVLTIGTLIAHLPRIHVEERALEELFGDPYRQFERKRKRLIPGVW